MDIKNKILAVLKPLSLRVLDFFKKKETATRTELTKMDEADIIIALLPLAIFGCLLFGLRAVLVVSVCIAVCLGADFLWDIIFKKERKGINFSAIITGLLLGLTLNSVLNVALCVLLSVVTIALMKTIFKDKPQFVAFPILVTRILLAVVFFGAFSHYVLPFVHTPVQWLPFDNLYIPSFSSYYYPAKYLFFGLHSGNIGETSVLLITVSGIYLMLRKLINPIIPLSFIATSFLLSLIFGEGLAVSLMGGGLFFAAMFMTLDYSFKTSPRYKKLLYGVACGLLTFVLRKLFKTESVLLAVLITDFVFFYVTQRNIKRTINFIKKPDFKKLLNKVKRVFSV